MSWFSCLSSPSAGTRGVHHLTQLYGRAKIKPSLPHNHSLPSSSANQRMPPQLSRHAFHVTLLCVDFNYATWEKNWTVNINMLHLAIWLPNTWQVLTASLLRTDLRGRIHMVPGNVRVRSLLYSTFTAEAIIEDYLSSHILFHLTQILPTIASTCRTRFFKNFC